MYHLMPLQPGFVQLYIASVGNSREEWFGGCVTHGWRPPWRTAPDVRFQDADDLSRHMIHHNGFSAELFFIYGCSPTLIPVDISVSPRHFANVARLSSQAVPYSIFTKRPSVFDYPTCFPATAPNALSCFAMGLGAEEKRGHSVMFKRLRRWLVRSNGIPILECLP